MDSNLSTYKLKVAVKELGILSKLKHKNVIPLICGYYIERDTVMIAMPEMKGDLKSEIRRPVNYWSFKKKVGIMCEILDGLTYVHQEGIVHRDIKPDNILIGHHGEIMIADFGQTRELGSSRPDEVERLAVIPYKAPELVFRELGIKANCKENGDVRNSKGQDVFASGCIFGELITGGVLFDVQTNKAFFEGWVDYVWYALSGN